MSCTLPTATLLQNAEQSFVDSNGQPYANGKVYFYVPETSTPKNTWKDPEQATLNTNPVVLDASGRATIYGAGVYRQVLYDQYGNLVWDNLTTDYLYIVSVTQGYWVVGPCSALGYNLTLNCGVLSNTYTLTTGIGVGGTVAFSDAQFTINGGGHITLTPQSGYSSVAINGGTVATTLDIGPGYVGQHQRVEFIQVGTTSSLNFGTTVAFGADIPSFTATAIVGYRDLLQFFCLDGSHWALAAVNHGFAY